jgi:hypothetical protein
MASMVLQDSTLESQTLSVNAPLDWAPYMRDLFGVLMCLVHQPI